MVDVLGMNQETIDSFQSLQDVYLHPYKEKY